MSPYFELKHYRIVPNPRPILCLYYHPAIGIIRVMNTLTIKIPDQLEDALAAASTQEHTSKSALVRRALETYLAQRQSATPFVSALDKAGDLVGCFKGGPRALASNQEHMTGFGED